MAHRTSRPRACPPLREPGSRCACTERGLALVEIAIALLVIAVATLGSVSWTLSGVNLEVDTRETNAAHDVMRRLLEELQDVPFDEMFARFNANADDDPLGPGTALGGSFTIEPDRKEEFLVVRGLPPDPTVAYRTVPIQVQIAFPVDEDGHLSETALGPSWSARAWDLDGNGSTTDSDLSTKYRVLPIRVTLSWHGTQGTRSIEHVRLMTRRVRPEGTE